MYLSKMQVTAYDIEADVPGADQLHQSIVWVLSPNKKEWAPTAIQIVCRRHPELDDSSVRFEALQLAWVRAAGVKDREALAEFLRKNAWQEYEGLLDEGVEAAMAAKAAKINREGLLSQLALLMEQTGTLPVLIDLQNYLNAQEADHG
jgi:hypothetical protein